MKKIRLKKRSRSELLKRETELLKEIGVLEVKHLKVEDGLQLKIRKLEITLDRSSQAENDLEAAMQYIRILNHDFRRALSPIIEFSNLLLEESFSPIETREFLQLILSAGQKLLEKMSSYLLFLKIEQGKEIELGKTPRLISDLISEIERIFSNFGRIERLHFSCSPELKKEFVSLEEGLVDSLLVNLIQNALEAAPRRSQININLFKEGKYFCLSISNLGEVPEKIKGRLFQKFATSKKHGNGLGLYSAKLIAQAHGGSLKYTPFSGGTRFTVSIPFK